MALKFRDQVMSRLGVSSLTLTPLENESIHVKRIGFSGFPDGAHATFRIGRTIVGFIQITYNGQATFPIPASHSNNTSPFINENFEKIDLTYPVANGERFSITTSHPGNIEVIYDIYDEGDIKNTNPNGSNSPVLTYLVYLTRNTAVTTGTTESYVLLNSMLNPDDFPRFPLDVVPDGQEFDVHSIGTIALSRGNGTANVGHTRFTRMRYNRETLFDPEDRGWFTQGLSTFTGNAFDYTQTLNVLPFNQVNQEYINRFNPPLTFKRGDELRIEQSLLAGAAGSVEANRLMTCLLITQRRV